MRRARVFFVDQIFSAGDEVFPGVRLGFFFSREVPFFAVLTASPHAGHRDHAASLQPGQKSRSEEWLGVGYAVGAIAIEQSWICTIALQTSLVENYQGHHNAIMAFHLD